MVAPACPAGAPTVGAPTPHSGGLVSDEAASPRWVTIPNLVSVVRLLAVPAFLWLLLAEDNPAAAGILLLAVGVTDWVDGYLARVLDQVSEVGKFLDPLADRLAVAAALIGGWIAGVVPALLAGALLLREGLVALGALTLGVAARAKLPVRYLGKLATFLLYGAIPSFYLAAAGVAPGFFEAAGWVAGVIGTVLYYVVGWQYGWDLVDALRRTREGSG